ncbi:MAG: MFS transporter, partial [Muribaculaceae bacterium]|nr:MFS transporter [Muribaculaceae bacterium]
MKYVNSGNGKMPLISLLAILAISLTINLPGLAVSPMLGKLHHIFNSSELESQLITSLPNLVMIPVVLIAGRIAVPRWQTAVLTTGLAIFFASGFVSLFADSMGLLIFLG